VENKIGLEINTKLLAFDGVIGRRDYIINNFIISLISQIFTSPIFFGRLHSLDFNSSLFSQLTDTQKIIMAVTTLICTIFSLSNMTRRLSDIFDKKADIQIYSISATFFILSFPCMFINLRNSLPFYLILLIFSLFLMIKKGKVTGNYPIDPIKKFNWGAFFGTWIWGLFNKTYITLWEIPLSLTQAGQITFPLICGLKGNEWAYKNKHYQDIEAFHKSQKKQTCIFVTVIIIGYLLLTILFMTVIIGAVTSYLSKPEKRIKFEHKLNNFIEKSAHQTFTKVEITENENKVYMNPIVWKDLDIKEKMNVYKLAYTYSETKRKTSNQRFIPGLEMERTTIYSNYNGEILAKFKPEQKDKNKNFIETVKQGIQDYHFNYNPQIPSKISKSKIQKKTL
jgi:hypothetical protein